MKVKIRNCENTVFNLNSLFASHKSIKQKETESYFFPTKDQRIDVNWKISDLSIYFHAIFFRTKRKKIFCVRFRIKINGLIMLSNLVIYDSVNCIVQQSWNNEKFLSIHSLIQTWLMFKFRNWHLINLTLFASL